MPYITALKGEVLRLRADNAKRHIAAGNKFLLPEDVAKAYSSPLASGETKTTGKN